MLDNENESLGQVTGDPEVHEPSQEQVAFKEVAGQVRANVTGTKAAGPVEELLGEVGGNIDADRLPAAEQTLKEAATDTEEVPVKKAA